MIILRNSLLYIISTGISKGLPFLLLPLLTRVLSVDEYGVLGIATVIASILAIIIGFNPSLFVVARFHKTDKHQLGAYIYQILIITIICCVLLAPVFMLFPEVLGSYGITPVMSIVILLVALTRVLINLGLTVVQMEKKAMFYLILNIFFAVPMLFFIYILVVASTQGWEGVLISELIVGGGLSLFLFSFLVRKHYIRSVCHVKMVKDFLRFSVPLIPHVMAFWVMSYIDRLFLAEMTDMETVGLYSTAYMLGLGMSLVHESVHRAWQPYFYEYLAKDNQEIKKRMVKYTWLYYAGSIVAFLVYVEMVRLLLPILVGEEYLPAMEFVPLLVLGYTVLGMYRVIAGYLYHNSRTLTLAAVTVFSALINIIMNYILIPEYGAIGAAQATLIAFLALFLIVKVIVVRTSDMPWLKVFP